MLGQRTFNRPMKPIKRQKNVSIFAASYIAVDQRPHKTMMVDAVMSALRRFPQMLTQFPPDWPNASHHASTSPCSTPLCLGIALAAARHGKNLRSWTSICFAATS